MTPCHKVRAPRGAGPAGEGESAVWFYFTLYLRRAARATVGRHARRKRNCPQDVVG